MSGALRGLTTVRTALPPPARRAVRAVVDPVLAPLGSVAGVRVDAGDAPAVALTFDDGPDPLGTPAVLDALAAAGVRATFFVLVDRADRHPALVRRLVDHGHEVGLHGADHRRLTALDPRAVRRDLRAARARLEHLAGVPVRWFRPPFGSQSVATFLAARRAGLAPVVWTTEGEDWIDQPVARVADRIMAGVVDGGIVLLHDGLAADPTEATTTDPLRRVRGDIVVEVLARLAAAGTRAATVGDLVATRPLRRTAWFRP